jgi:hypothetical protein
VEYEIRFEKDDYRSYPYLVPMGAVRAWIGSLDPQPDDIEISIS